MLPARAAYSCLMTGRGRARGIRTARGTPGVRRHAPRTVPP